MGSLPSTEAPRVASRASVCGAFGAKARMADEERTPGVTPSDAFVAQQRDVEARSCIQLWLSAAVDLQELEQV